MEIEHIPAVDAKDMPPEVEDYCMERGWSTHYQNEIVQVYDDGNPFAEWLKTNGYVFRSKKETYQNFDSVGIFAT